MGVSYGADYIKSIIGILKIVEIILCILVLIFMNVRSGHGHGYYYYDLDALMAACVVGLVVSVLVLLLSCFFGKDCDPFLKWMWIAYGILAIWFIVVGIIYIFRDHPTMIFIADILGIITGVVYLLDTIFSIKAYGVKC
ncbi:hypothetical protein JTB14_017538 [Gonioctena quinquepunctata]|nr:hypothetical protein JTB14_017538 [Gonioctena quinquepunctata]